MDVERNLTIGHSHMLKQRDERKKCSLQKRSCGNAYPVADIENSDVEKLTKMSKRLEDDGCKRWKREWKKGKMVRLI